MLFTRPTVVLLLLLTIRTLFSSQRLDALCAALQGDAQYLQLAQFSYSSLHLTAQQLSAMDCVACGVDPRRSVGLWTLVEPSASARSAQTVHPQCNRRQCHVPVQPHAVRSSTHVCWLFYDSVSRFPQPSDQAIDGNCIRQRSNTVTAPPQYCSCGGARGRPATQLAGTSASPMIPP